MNIVNLNESGFANLETGQLELELRVVRGEGGPLSIRSASGKDLTFVSVSPTKWVLPGISEPVKVVVESRSGVFPAPTELRLSVRNSNDASVLIVCPLVDVSELAETVLCELSPNAHGLTTVRAVTSVVVPDKSLSSLAQGASFSSRRLATQGRIPSSSRGLMLLVDVSASMVIHRDSGLLQTLCEVALGIDRGMGDGGDVPAYAVGRSIAPLPPLNPDSAPNYSDLSAMRTAGTGFRLSPIVQPGVVDVQDRTAVIVTDGTPADLASFAETATDTPGSRWRLAIIGPPLKPRVLQAFPGAAAIAETLRPEGLVSAPGHREAMDRLVMDLIGRTDANSGGRQ